MGSRIQRPSERLHDVRGEKGVLDWGSKRGKKEWKRMRKQEGRIKQMISLGESFDAIGFCGLLSFHSKTTS